MNDSKDWIKKQLEVYPLHLLIIAGTLLRLFKLDFNSLWLDEAATYSLSVVPLDQIWANMAAGEFNPPLFFVIEHFMLMLGNNEIVLRFMPALFGILTIPVMYLVGKEFKDETVGLIAAAMVTFSPFLILYSQEARAYSLLMLLCCGMMYYFLIGLKKNEPYEWFMFALIAVIATWTHFYSLVFIVILCAYALLKYRMEIRPLFFALGFWFFACIPIFITMGSLIGMRTATAPTYGLSGMDLVVQTILQLFGYSDIIAVIFLLLFAAGVMWSFFNAYEQFSILIWITFLTIGISVMLSSFIPMMPRYEIFLIIPFALGIAMAHKPIANMHLLPEGRPKQYTVIIFSVFFMLVACPFYINYYQNYTKEDWRSVSGNIESLTQQGDVIIAVPNYVILPLEYYYNAAEDGTKLVGLSNLTEIESEQRNNPNATFYVVTQDIRAVDPHMITGTWLMQNTFIVAQDAGVTILRGLPDV